MHAFHLRATARHTAITILSEVNHGTSSPPLKPIGCALAAAAALCVPIRARKSYIFMMRIWACVLFPHTNALAMLLLPFGVPRVLRNSHLHASVR